MAQSLQVYLQGAVCDRPEKNRDHESQKLIHIESRPAPGFPDGIEQARTGDDEKKRHHPPRGKDVPYFHPDKGIGILDVPIAQIKKSSTVINKNDQDGPYAKPVKFIFSARRICNHPNPRAGMLIRLYPLFEQLGAGPGSLRR